MAHVATSPLRFKRMNKRTEKATLKKNMQNINIIGNLFRKYNSPLQAILLCLIQESHWKLSYFQSLTKRLFGFLDNMNFHEAILALRESRLIDLAESWQDDKISQKKYTLILFSFGCLFMVTEFYIPLRY